MSEEEARKLASQLTTHQRAMLLDIGDGKPREYALGVTGFALLRAKLVFVNELGARQLTNDGHAVRRVIERNPHAS